MTFKYNMLALVLLCIISPFSVLADEVEIDGLKYELNDDNSTATVIGYTENLSRKDIIIPESVKYNGNVFSVVAIGDEAFSGCSWMNSITIPNSVTSIGNGVFKECSGLEQLIFEDGNETLSLGHNERIPFLACPGLFSACPIKTIYLGRNLSYTAGVQYIGGSTSNPVKYCSPFYARDELTSVTISNFVTSIPTELFERCDGLTSVEIPTTITSIFGSAFSECSGLISVNIPESVLFIGPRAFEGCVSFTELIIPNSVTYIGSWAFQDCSGLTSAIIGNSVTEIQQKTFYGCTSLTSVIIGNSVSTIGSWAFNLCNSLMTVEVLNPEPPMFISNDPFDDDVYRNATLIVPNGSLETYKTYYGWKKFFEVAPEAIEMTISDMELIEGETVTLTVYITPEDATDNSVAWSSSDEAVAIVDATGKVTAIKPGKATITASTENGLKATCTITVVAATVDAAGLTLNLEEAEIIENNTLQLTATVTPADATDKSVSWSSSDEAVATADASGLVTAIKPGKATITATTANNLTATCAVTVVAKPSRIEGMDGDDVSGVRVEGGNIIAPEGSEVFDLNGRRVSAKGLSSGIYIVRIPGAKAIKVIVK